MAVNFVEIKNDQDWDKFIVENNGDFLQSWAWGELQRKEGAGVKRFAIYYSESHLANFQIFEFNNKAGSYLYLPRGPVVKNHTSCNSDVLRTAFADFLKHISQKSFFVLYEPLNSLILPTAGIVCKNRQPEKTLTISLESPIEQIFHGLVNSRRQGVNFAKKTGVQVTYANSKEYFESFWKLLLKTSVRKDFGIFNKSHYINISDILPSEIFLAQKNNEVLAAAQVVLWGNTVTYLHASSSDKKLRAPDLLVWKIIEYGKERGFNKFDFWGIDENRWPGVTFFKKSFGGNETKYPQAIAIINKPIKYLAYNLYNKIRRHIP